MARDFFTYDELLEQERAAAAVAGPEPEPEPDKVVDPFSGHVCPRCGAKTRWMTRPVYFDRPGKEVTYSRKTVSLFGKTYAFEVASDADDYTVYKDPHITYERDEKGEIVKYHRFDVYCKACNVEYESERLGAF